MGVPRALRLADRLVIDGLNLLGAFCLLTWVNFVLWSLGQQLIIVAMGDRIGFGTGELSWLGALFSGKSAAAAPLGFGPSIIILSLLVRKRRPLSVEQVASIWRRGLAATAGVLLIICLGLYLSDLAGLDAALSQRSLPNPWMLVLLLHVLTCAGVIAAAVATGKGRQRILGWVVGLLALMFLALFSATQWTLGSSTQSSPFDDPFGVLWHFGRLTLAGVLAIAALGLSAVGGWWVGRRDQSPDRPGSVGIFCILVLLAIISFVIFRFQSPNTLLCMITWPWPMQRAFATVATVLVCAVALVLAFRGGRVARG